VVVVVVVAAVLAGTPSDKLVGHIQNRQKTLEFCWMVLLILSSCSFW